MQATVKLTLAPRFHHMQRMAHKTTLRNVFSKLTSRYVVYAKYSNQKPTAKHYAKTWGEAMEWVACYSHTDVCTVYERSFGFEANIPVAQRNHTGFRGMA